MKKNYKMGKNFYVLMLSLIVLGSCKKEKAEIKEETYGSSKLSYKALNTMIDSLQYNHPLMLDLNNDGQTDYYLSSVLIEYNDLPYLYLYINRKTPHLNQILVQQGEELPLNALWAVPLNKDTPIGQSAAANSVWSEVELKTALLNVSENENGRILGGEWIGKKDKYLGLKFEINGQYHYGWLRISHNVNESKLAILDYAYHKIPGQAIPAGQK